MLNFLGKHIEFTNHFKYNDFSYINPVRSHHHIHLVFSSSLFTLNYNRTRIFHLPQPHTRHRYPLTTAQITIWFLYSSAKAAPPLWTKSYGNLTHYLQNCTKPSLATLRTETTWTLYLQFFLPKLQSLLRFLPATV